MILSATLTTLDPGNILEAAKNLEDRHDYCRFDHNITLNIELKQQWNSLD